MKLYEAKQEKKKQIQEQKRRKDQRDQKRNWSWGMLFLLFCAGFAFAYLVGYTYGWHKALGNDGVFEPKPIDKIWK